ncbi:hypothetical protein DB29_02185 [Shouchella clausii]|nr:hypothetical protein DB29_02185 [Shouchella clausii]
MKIKNELYRVGGKCPKSVFKTYFSRMCFFHLCNVNAANC